MTGDLFLPRLTNFNDRTSLEPRLELLRSHSEGESLWLLRERTSIVKQQGMQLLLFVEKDVGCSSLIYVQYPHMGWQGIRWTHISYGQFHGCPHHTQHRLISSKWSSSLDVLWLLGQVHHPHKYISPGVLPIRTPLVGM